MFDYFGFDPKLLSDEELLAKEIDLQAKLMYASRFSSSDIVGNIQMLLMNIEAERHERLARVLFQDRDQMFPPVIESDPGLAEPDKANAKPDKGKITPQSKPRVTITRTSRPVTNGDPGESS